MRMQTFILTTEIVSLISVYLCTSVYLCMKVKAYQLKWDPFVNELRGLLKSYSFYQQTIYLFLIHCHSILIVSVVVTSFNQIPDCYIQEESYVKKSTLNHLMKPIIHCRSIVWNFSEESSFLGMVNSWLNWPFSRIIIPLCHSHSFFCNVM
jgi:hypothetical protein